MILEITDWVNGIRRDNYVDTKQIDAIQKLPSKIAIFLKSGNIMYLEDIKSNESDIEVERILKYWGR